VGQVPTSRVFVVDDEHLIVSTLAAILNMSGFSARAFSGPLEALAAARSDVPFSGIELAIQMKARYPRCKILLCSAQAHTADLLKDVRHRGHHFRLLVKPIFPTEMLWEIDKTEDEPISQPKGGSAPSTMSQINLFWPLKTTERSQPAVRN
jgi:CheY-like chemotaxis protein